jgi:flagellar basal body-associated protein FliL
MVIKNLNLFGKKIVFLLLFSTHIFAYDFVLLNNSSVEDEFIIDTINDQLKNYYEDKNNKIVFHELDNKDAILKLTKNYDYTDDKKTQEELISNNEELEDDLRLIFKTKYFLIISESIDREGRSELKVVLKVDNINYLDTQFIMPRLDDKELHYVNTITNIVLTYISYKNRDFIKVNQL